MTRLLHIIPFFSLGGAARSLAACAKACSRQAGITHAAASLVPTQDSRALEFLRQHGVAPLDAPDRESLSQAIDKADIVQVHYWNHPRLNDWLRSELPAMRLVIQVHIGGLHAPHVITKELVDLADVILTTSPFSSDLPIFAAMDPRKRRDKVFMVYSAADFALLEGFAPKAHPGFNVTYLGSVGFQKMHPDFVAMSGEIRVPDARFLVCGPGEGYGDLKRQASTLGMENRFDFRGSVPNARPILEITDVFGYPLCPDNYSTGELVLHEAAFAGIPAVVLPHGGAPRSVVHNYTGYVVRDAQEYAEAVEHLYHRPDERQRLGHNAREYARHLFGAENAAQATIPLYDRLMARPKRDRAFGLSDADDPASSPERFADCMLETIGGKGAWRFVESLGDSAPCFLASLLAEDPQEALAADEVIARSSPVLVLTGLFDYRDYYPEDGFLQFWTGLVLRFQGDLSAANAAFIQANSLGCDHWRVFWNLALCAEALGQTAMAREALGRVISQAPKLIGAQEMLNRLLNVPDSQTTSVADLRLRRELYRQAGDMAKAEEQALALLALAPDHGDFEAYYLIGLGWHRGGTTCRAEAIYERMGSDPRVPAELAAWASFKHGEIHRDSGRPDLAQACFSRALELKPNLAKAAICLCPPDTSLCVSISQNNGDQGIVIEMDPLDEELWKYHFSLRRPDLVSLSLAPGSSELEWTCLARLLVRHVVPGGTVRLSLPPEEAETKIQECVEVFRQAGLSVQRPSGSETLLLTP